MKEVVKLKRAVRRLTLRVRVLNTKVLVAKNKANALALRVSALENRP